MGGIVSRRSSNANTGNSSSSSGAARPAASEAVKNSWQRVRDKGVDLVGVAVFVKLFEKDPQTFQMFKTFRDEQDWPQSKAFKFHSKAFLNVIGSAVVNVQSEEALHATMHTLGAAHSLFDIRDEHFDILREELVVQLQLLLQQDFTDEVRAAWCTASDNVMHAMKFAMTHGSGKA